jgi:hypothetical protein
MSVGPRRQPVGHKNAICIGGRDARGMLLSRFYEMAAMLLAENSHRPVRKRERTLQRFRSPEHAQRFLEPFSTVQNHFRPRHLLLAANQYHRLRAQRFHQWREAARLEPVAVA